MYLRSPDQKATCLVTTNLWLTVQAFPPLPHPRNQLWLFTIESEKLLLQAIFNSTEKMESETLKTSLATLEICKCLALLEAPTLLELRYK